MLIRTILFKQGKEGNQKSQQAFRSFPLFWQFVSIGGCQTMEGNNNKKSSKNITYTFLIDLFQTLVCCTFSQYLVLKI